MTGDCEKPLSEIMGEMGALAEEINVVRELAEKIRERLAPVMKPSGLFGGPKKDEMEPVLSPVSLAIRESGKRVNGIGEVLNEIDARLAL